jgi:integrase
MKKPVLKVRPYKHSTTHPFLLDLRAYGKGRMFFKNRATADAERRRQETSLARHGREALGMSPREMSDFITAKKKLADYGETINDAVKHRVDYLERIRRCKTTVKELVAELIDAKKKDGRSEIYVRDLRNLLAIFSRDFGERPVAAITVEDLDNWLRALPGSPKTRTNFRTVVGVLFSYAVRRRMLDSNPVMHTAKPKLIDSPPEIFTVDELRTLLEAAQQKAPSVLPMLAIGAFAGLRDAEIKRLDWGEVDLTRGFIDVKAAKAKSARRRVIEIQPNLAEWLRPYSQMEGRLVPEGYRSSLEKVREAAELTSWRKNGLRHSFASYRLAGIHDAPRVAAELGHMSPVMLYNTYREVVRPEDADLYWKIVPKEESGGKLVAFAAGGHGKGVRS